jgi:hypothetical protein
MLIETLLIANYCTMLMVYLRQKTDFFEKNVNFVVECTVGNKGVDVLVIITVTVPRRLFVTALQ